MFSTKNILFSSDHGLCACVGNIGHTSEQKNEQTTRKDGSFPVVPRDTSVQKKFVCHDTQNNGKFKTKASSACSSRDTQYDLESTFFDLQLSRRNILLGKVNIATLENP